MIVDGIDLGRRYHISEIMELYHKGRLRKVAVQGYIVRADADGMVGFVPASESTLFNMGWEADESEAGLYHGVRGGRTYQSKSDMAEAMRQEVEREHPMVRRSAQEKKASLIQRLLRTAKVYGTIPGLKDEQISAMIGEPWKTGVSVVTNQMLERVAAHYMKQGELQNIEADRKRVVKAHPLAHSAS